LSLAATDQISYGVLVDREARLPYEATSSGSVLLLRKDSRAAPFLFPYFGELKEPFQSRSPSITGSLPSRCDDLNPDSGAESDSPTHRASIPRHIF